jgi:hypothetical protein
MAVSSAGRAATNSAVPSGRTDERHGSSSCYSESKQIPVFFAGASEETLAGREASPFEFQFAANLAAKNSSGVKPGFIAR